MSARTSSRPGTGVYVVRRVGRGARKVGHGLGLRLQPRRPWQRILAGVVGLVHLVVAFFVLGVFSVPSGFHGWLPTALVYLPGVVLLTLGIGLGRWPVAVAWAAGTALLLGTLAHLGAPPTHERIEAVAAEMGTPAGWTTIDDGSWTGNTWGLWSSWPQVTYTYATPEPPQAAAAEYATRLEAVGWTQQASVHASGPATPGTVSQAWEKGRWTVQVRVAGPESVPRRFDTLVPPGQTRVDLYFDGQR